MLFRIFNFKNKSTDLKDLRQDIKNKTKKSFILKERTNNYEKENELRILENLQKKKINEDYLDNLSFILYNCHNEQKYPKKRMNLNKAKFVLDENQDLSLILPKLNTINNCHEKKRYKSEMKNCNNFNNNENVSQNDIKDVTDNIEVIDNSNNNNTNNNNDDDINDRSNYKSNDYKFIKNKYYINTSNFSNYNSIRKNRNIKDYLLEKEVSEEKERFIYKNLRTRTNFYNTSKDSLNTKRNSILVKENNTSYNSNNNNSFNNSNAIPKIETSQQERLPTEPCVSKNSWKKANSKNPYKNDMKVLFTPKQIESLDKNIFNTLMKGRGGRLIPKQQEKLKFLSELTVFSDMNYFNEKKEILNKMKIKKINKEQNEFSSVIKVGNKKNNLFLVNKKLKYCAGYRTIENLMEDLKNRRKIEHYKIRCKFNKLKSDINALEKNAENSIREARIASQKIEDFIRFTLSNRKSITEKSETPKHAEILDLQFDSGF